MFGTLGYTPNSNTQTHTKGGKVRGDLSAIFTYRYIRRYKKEGRRKDGEREEGKECGLIITCY